MESEFEKEFYFRKEIEDQICRYIESTYGNRLDSPNSAPGYIWEDIKSGDYMLNSKYANMPKKITIKYLHNEPENFCGFTWGCNNMKRISQFMCDECKKEYEEDPDAFK